MKVGVEELKEQMVEADRAIAEITASMAELEKKKSKVFIPAHNTNLLRLSV